ncbi:hypothetical protein GCM10011515_11060 [Tsuneonella deserti]|uniref:Uncharacterized protein n=1 Tax=Tsuneonella deserti TaxID=2035528 RepID=A0ABQ1S6F7_9SPHN|nr:hypothetical protein [Tsuneonella deserti]GGD93099.1 hypothetical protein GCM10011515_11060 [Tsuneonella deserti]
MSHNANVIHANDSFQSQYNMSLLNSKDPVQAEYIAAMTAAKCVSRRAKGEAAKYIGGPQTDDPGYAALTGLLTKKFANCLSGVQKAIPVAVVNAALAEQLLGEMPETMPDKAASLDTGKAHSYYLTNGKIDSLDALSRCIAVNSPGLVQKALKTQAGSNEEKAALATAYSSTPECGVTAAPQIASVQHREMLALGLYQWLHLID